MRLEFDAATKKAARKRANGFCEGKGCGAALGPQNPGEVDHIEECWEGGDNSLGNAQVLGRKCGCHPKKTAEAAARRAKADRQKARHEDTKPKPSRPLPGTRASGWRHKMTGEWERR